MYYRITGEQRRAKLMPHKLILTVHHLCRGLCDFNVFKLFGVIKNVFSHNVISYLFAILSRYRGHCKPMLRGKRQISDDLWSRLGR